MDTKFSSISLSKSLLALGSKLIRLKQRLYPADRKLSHADIYARGREAIHAELSKAKGESK